MKIDGFNLDLAVRVLADIKEAKASKSGRHSQGSWALATEDVVRRMPRRRAGFMGNAYVGNAGGEHGTSQCIAGWTLVEENVPMLYVPNTGKYEYSAGFAVYQGQVLRIGQVAEALLGLQNAPKHWDEPYPVLFSSLSPMWLVYKRISSYAGISFWQLRKLVKAQVKKYQLTDQVPAAMEQEVITTSV